ncbi:MAG: hypothetical protein RMM17_10830 [Acidobacteriota bacterium]|nr:hypothetical protein [Blastocatellia bacterium]MDW8413166.1 hypothetical protein [Acidobacteriota bacterium]
MERIILGIENIPKNQLAGQIKQKGYDEWKKLSNPEDKLGVAKTILGKIEKEKMQKTFKDCKELKEFVKV